MTRADHPVPADQRQRLLLFNLRTDVDDHILGFTTRWINALAPYYAHVDVLTMHKGRIDVRDNVRVYSAGREEGLSKGRRVLRFYTVLARLLLRQRYDACFAHMMPLFAAMGAPLLRVRGVPVTTWYTHRERTRQVEWATRFSFRVVSAVPSSFPLDTPKLRPIGHGIDANFFAPDDSVMQVTPPRIVQVARLTPIKHQHVLLHATQNLACEVVFVGDVPDGYDDSYKHELHALAADLDMAQKVTFAGAQTPDQVRDWLHSATVAVNLSPAGLFDKAALESMACAVPTLVCNSAFDSLTGAHTPLLQLPAPDAPLALTEQLTALLALSAEGRARMGDELRDAVVTQHSLQALVHKLIAVMHTGEFTSR